MTKPYPPHRTTPAATPMPQRHVQTRPVETLTVAQLMRAAELAGNLVLVSIPGKKP